MSEQIGPENRASWLQTIQLSLAMLVAFVGSILLVLFVEMMGYMKQDCNDLLSEVQRQKCLYRTAEIEGAFYPWGLIGIAAYLLALLGLVVCFGWLNNRWQQLGWWRPGLTALYWLLLAPGAAGLVYACGFMELNPYLPWG